MRGGAFSLLGPISKGSGDGSPDAVTEDDAALAAFDKTLQQQLLWLQLLTPAILGCADGQVAAIKRHIASLPGIAKLAFV